MSRVRDAWNKREVRRRIEEQLEIVEHAIWQDKPYTAVKMIAKFNGAQYERYGFTKVCYPDRWSATYGIELATDKVKSKISKAIMNGESA